MLTNVFLKTSLLQNPRDPQVCKNLLKANRQLQNFSFTDKLLRALYQIDSSNPNLIKEVIHHVDQGALSSVSLVPKLVVGNAAYGAYGLVDRSQLLEICQASERYFRRKLADSQIDIRKQILTLQGKSAVEIEEELQQTQKPTEVASQVSSYSFVNIVFNYFNDASQASSASGSNSEQMNKLQ